ncbi:MAG: hypothetical protein Q9217_000507 [Psora testacea]
MRKRFHGLKRIKLRQSWNKYNLYNLSRAETQTTLHRTFFQQKWTAKSISRAYHGEVIREKQWKRMFRSSVRAVVPMDYEYLAKHDGSEQAAGRGSGADVPPEKRLKLYPRTPYLNMVYAPMERRLDTAIFRALFASSTRQARQFVVHGYVKVNGKKGQMIYPGYQLNPGDMFQVDPDRVMFATGAPKDSAERRAGRRYRVEAANNKSAGRDDSSAPAEPLESSEPQPRPPAPSNPESTPEDQAKKNKDTKISLQMLLQRAKELLSTPSTSLTAKRKQDLRAFQRTVRRTLSRPDSFRTADLDTQLQEILTRMTAASAPLRSLEPALADAATDLPTLSTPSLNAEVTTLSPEQLRVLRRALIEARENPVDPSKPYATPWRPREFMSAFAFVPRYLEVHQRVCAAVYIRHPVARPGLAEVPTPFALETNSLAHNWYLRRR